MASGGFTSGNNVVMAQQDQLGMGQKVQIVLRQLASWRGVLAIIAAQVMSCIHLAAMRDSLSVG